MPSFRKEWHARRHPGLPPDSLGSQPQEIQLTSHIWGTSPCQKVGHSPDLSKASSMSASKRFKLQGKTTETGKIASLKYSAKLSMILACRTRRGLADHDDTWKDMMV
jgi:hypothetical protein